MRKGISGGSGGVLIRGAILSCALASPHTVAMAGEVPGQGASSPDETILFEEIPTVYGASKYDQKASEAPASVSVVTGEEIRRFGLRNLADVVRRARHLVTLGAEFRNNFRLRQENIDLPGPLPERPSGSQRCADPGSEEHIQDLIPQDGRTFRFTITRLFSVK